MDEEKGSSLGLVVMVVVGLVVLWLVVGAVFSIVKTVVTLAAAGLLLYGLYRLLGSKSDA